jgi:hypothetical protein
MAITSSEIVRRFGFHPATPETTPLFEENRTWGIELAHHIVDTVPEGREQSLALTALQECIMWANAAVACHEERSA